MANSRLRHWLSRLRERAPLSEEMPDSEVLGHFVASGDEAAFALLLRRHGPLVHGLCRRLLRDVHLAEDAFQATSLVLVRKAAGIRKRGSLSCWLHGVAYRVAREARRRADTRTLHSEGEIPPSAEPLEADPGPEEAAMAAELCIHLD